MYHKTVRPVHLFRLHHYMNMSSVLLLLRNSTERERGDPAVADEKKKAQNVYITVIRKEISANQGCSLRNAPPKTRMRPSGQFSRVVNTDTRRIIRNADEHE